MKSSPLAQGRRVRLVVRRVEPWTVLKFSVLLFATLYLVFLVAGLVLWGAATATGVRHNIEKFIGDLIASDNFRILGPTMLRASIVGGFVLVVLGTGANVLMAVLYNLISDVIGGITVVFEERPTRRHLRPQARPQPEDHPAPPVKPVRSARRRPPAGAGRPPEPLQPKARQHDTTPVTELAEIEEAELTRPSSE